MKFDYSTSSDRDRQSYRVLWCVTARHAGAIVSEQLRHVFARCTLIHAALGLLVQRALSRTGALAVRIQVVVTWLAYNGVGHEVRVA